MSSLKFRTSSTKATFVTSLDTKGVKTLTLADKNAVWGGKGNVVLLKRIAIYLPFQRKHTKKYQWNSENHLWLKVPGHFRSGIQMGGSSPQRDMSEICILTSWNLRQSKGVVSEVGAHENSHLESWSFNSWPFYLRVGGHQQPSKKGHGNSPPQKGHDRRIARIVHLKTLNWKRKPSEPSSNLLKLPAVQLCSMFLGKSIPEFWETEKSKRSRAMSKQFGCTWLFLKLIALVIQTLRLS